MSGAREPTASRSMLVLHGASLRLKRQAAELRRCMLTGLRAPSVLPRRHTAYVWNSSRQSLAVPVVCGVVLGRRGESVTGLGSGQGVDGRCWGQFVVAARQGRGPLRGHLIPIRVFFAGSVRCSTCCTPVGPKAQLL
jgi:hypothetical protein